MGSKICMNTSCGATATSQWKRGWKLKSGQIADLCLNCGSAYEKLAYCETFHCEETGWRECSLCNKRLHCGCSASLPFVEIQDFGGVWCINCANSAGCHSVQRDVMPSEVQTAKTYTSGDLQNPQASNEFDADSLDSRKYLCFGNFMEGRDTRFTHWPQMNDGNVSFGKLQLDVERPMEIVGVGVANVSHPPVGTPSFPTLSDDKSSTRVKDMHEPQILPSLNISLGTPSDSSSFGLPLSGGVEEGDMSRTPFLQPGQKPRHTLPKTPWTNLLKGSEPNLSPGSQIRCARPPAEVRARNQLLPRYWPRITDQELEKLSGDLNSTIVPLFEKVLSASDASRIGRLVLPKACAEAYFPPINHSEGLPLKILDIKGTEWILQFRFWPNNNSRMYVLEGVNPCIQSMQLEAGDTVTFSRIDPGGKLVMGFRKASNSFEKQDSQTSPSPSGVPGDSSCSDVGDNQATANLHSGTLQLIRGSKENTGNALYERSNVESGDAGWSKNDKYKGKSNEDVLQQTVVSSDKKKTRNIGSKNRRLSMHSEDALELSVTWDEAQDLFRPPSSNPPNIIVVEEFEVEEYNEPPIIGKKTLFTNRPSGGQDQWAQCDKCAKWRKLPLDDLVPPKWSCSDNIWDLTRSSCFQPEEINSKELDIFFRVGKDPKRRKVMEGSELAQGSKPSGLDALAAAAVLGDPARIVVVEEPPIGATTKHPRHRAGCTCIVCSQPPSGKGNHKPNCACTVCSTLKRRSKTLMNRKKRRQSEQEAEVEQQKDREHKRGRQSEQEAEMEQIKDQEHQHPTEKSELNSQASPPKNTPRSEEGNRDRDVVGERECNGRETIDLNCDPTREEDVQAETPAGTGILSPVQAATVTTEMQMNQSLSQNQNGTANLLYAEQDKPSPTPPVLQPQDTKHSEPGPNPEPEPKPDNEHQVTAAEVEGRVS